MPAFFSDERRLAAARRVFQHLGRALDVPVSVRLWDGSLVPLGQAADGAASVAIAGPEVLGAVLRRPSLDTLFRQYVLGGIALEGVDLVAFMELARDAKKARKLRFADLRRGFPWRDGLSLLLARRRQDAIDHQVAGAEQGRAHSGRDDKALIQFHYDVSNDFYALFLDPEMVYSCAYFTDWSNALEQAQQDKLDLICRKLRLGAGERFLDIGCGWGALLCHAARHYGVTAHGVTLSQAQLDFARAKIARLGLTERVTASLANYMSLEGDYDKIASIGMYEHVGIDSYPAYFKKMRGLLTDGGLFLNHGITRRAKRNVKNFGKISPGKQVILKYIFPGSELDHIGHSLQVMESCGFEVHDLEGLRLHYGRTCRLWHERLAAEKDAAIGLVGPEQYRMWIAYLAGVTGAFEQGPLHIFQTLASKQSDKAASPLPPTRADLYREAEAAASEAPPKSSMVG